MQTNNNGMFRNEDPTQRNRMFILARQAVSNSEYSEARRYYDLLLAEEPNNWEAYYFDTLCWALENSDPEEEENCAVLLNRAIPEAIQLIVQYEKPQNQIDAFDTILHTINTYIRYKTASIENYYQENRRYLGLLPGWLFRKTEAYGSIYETYRNSVPFRFPNADNILSLVNDYYQRYADSHMRIMPSRQRRYIIRYIRY